MEFTLSVLIGIMMAVSSFFMLSANFIRFIFGLLIMGNAVNLLIFTVGRFNRGIAPIIPGDTGTSKQLLVNSLPQALILTSIVIGFALVSYAMVLAYRLEHEFETIDENLIINADPENNHKTSSITMTTESEQ